MKLAQNRLLIIATLILVLLVATLFTIRIEKAQANNNETYDTVYYFSDLPEEYSNRAYYETILNSSSATSSLTVVWWEELLSSTEQAQDTLPFYQRFMTWHEGLSSYSSMYCSYVVFELKNGFRPSGLEYSGDFTSSLADFFFAIDNIGAEIMFVCDTDESRFYYARDLLNHVDVHVNTDLDTIMIDSFVRRIENEIPGGDIQDTTIFLDQYYSQTYFLREYIMAYFAQVYPVSITVDYTTCETDDFFTDLLSAGNVRVIGYNMHGQYVDFATGNLYASPNTQGFEDLLVSYDDEFDGTLFRLRALGSTYYDTSEDWIDEISSLGDVYFGADIFINISKTVTWWSQFADYDNIYTLGSAVASFETTLASIFSTMIAFGDLSVYDIWFGECDVTYKPVIIGEGGWIYIPGRMLENWQYVEESDFDHQCNQL